MSNDREHPQLANVLSLVSSKAETVEEGVKAAIQKKQKAEVQGVDKSNIRDKLVTIMLCLAENPDSDTVAHLVKSLQNASEPIEILEVVGIGADH